MSRSSPPMTEEERRERLEHRDMLLHLRAVLATASGQHLIKYLFRNFEVGGVPELGLEGAFLMDRIGFLRAGQSIFRIVAEANADIAGHILAEIEKERHAEIDSINET